MSAVAEIKVYITYESLEGDIVEVENLMTRSHFLAMEGDPQWRREYSEKVLKSQDVKFKKIVATRIYPQLP